MTIDIERWSWMDEANCRGKDASVFFPTRGESVSEARALCSECEVQIECLEVALADYTIQGFWGGMSARERGRERDRRIRMGEPMAPRMIRTDPATGYTVGMPGEAS